MKSKIEACQVEDLEEVVNHCKEAGGGAGIGLLLINFNTAVQTIRCLDSILNSSLMPDSILLLDNASEIKDFNLLVQHCKSRFIPGLKLYRSSINIGFAQGSNLLIELALRDESCDKIVLLNNDAIAEKEMLHRLCEALRSPGRIGLAGGRMHRLSHPEQVDTLGISIYASLMPADRKSLDDGYIGPTGGCCILTREMLEDSRSVFGYYFDPRFFCYCEDTDLALRSLLLGYTPAYIDELLALHEGQASSGKVNNFVAYHGLRNVFWMHIKLMPRALLWKHGILILLAHFLTVGRHSVNGRFGLLINIYKDVFGRMPEFWYERRRIKNYMRENGHVIDSLLTQRFYRKGYARQLWKSMRG